jgi:hypothetical protein
MILRPRKLCRRAATVLEAAVVFPVALLFIFGLLIGGIGIFRYHQVAHIARETARFASVHGAQYAKKNTAAILAGTLPNVNKDYLINTVAAKYANSLSVSKLQITVTMAVIKPAATSVSSTETVDWDNTTENQSRSPYSVWTDNTTTPPTNNEVQNVVIVQVTYPWIPQLYLTGPINLTSTSVMPMSY